MKSFSSLFLVGCFSAMPLYASSFIELGNEYEEFYKERHRSNTMPYLAVQFKPIEDSSMFVYGNFSYRHMMRKDERPWGERGRQDLAIGWSHGYDNFWWGPQFQVRNEMYSNDTRRTEWRIYNNFTYYLSENTDFFHWGFISPVSNRTNHARGSDKVECDNMGDCKESDRFEYLDYYHELEFGLRHRLRWDKQLELVLYSEISKNSDLKKGQDNAWSDKGYDEWQVRVNYTQKFGDFTITPFVRHSFYRKFHSVDEGGKENLRTRVGVWGDYKIRDSLKLIYEVYHQTADTSSYRYSGNPWKGEEKYFMWKLAIRQSF